MALPLNFAGKLRFLRTRFCSTWNLRLLGSLSAPEASDCICWLAHVGVRPSLLDGPPGCDPGFYVVWCSFRLLRRYLAYRPPEVTRFYRLLGCVAAGPLALGPFTLMVESAGILGFRGI